MTSVMPLNQDNREATAILPEGFQLPRGTTSVTVLSSRIDEGYLATMQIPSCKAAASNRSTPRTPHEWRW
jgi:hypothetical protein